MTDRISFFVPGAPQPGGSKKAFVSRSTGNIVVKDDAMRNSSWRSVVALAAKQVMAVSGASPLRGALKLTVKFTVPRPKDHFSAGKKNAGKLKKRAPIYPITKPDSTKLLRSTEDALTGILWVDDAQISIQHVERIYSNTGTVGAEIAVEAIPDNYVGIQ